jgi:hypothetical protein
MRYPVLKGWQKRGNCFNNLSRSNGHSGSTPDNKNYTRIQEYLYPGINMIQQGFPCDPAGIIRFAHDPQRCGGICHRTTYAAAKLLSFFV